jgi:hypothetical protein
MEVSSHWYRRCCCCRSGYEAVVLGIRRRQIITANGTVYSLASTPQSCDQTRPRCILVRIRRAILGQAQRLRQL